MTFNVLHVDDEPDIREVVELSLGLDPDLAVTSCGSGVDAIAMVAQWAPDLVLLDVMMPVMDGPTTLRQMRAQLTTAHTPVVFMTARAQAREVESFISLGAVGVICKPFDPMTLAAEVRRYAFPAPSEMAGLTAKFHARLQSDAARLRDLARDGEARVRDIKLVAHSLAGAAGIFGAPLIGERAAMLVKVCDGVLAGAAPAGIERALGDLLDAIEQNTA